MGWNKILNKGYNINSDFPNYYPRVFVNGWDGRESAKRQYMNDLIWSSRIQARYGSGDNNINRSLMQTWIPTCLHDLLYCLLEQQKKKRN
uniref:Ovule protein n=1 Tax=Parastrongyloides trichosuri TaxID=131310 RepID=A0A0N5A7E0_PARTI